MRWEKNPTKLWRVTQQRVLLAKNWHFKKIWLAYLVMFNLCALSQFLMVPATKGLKAELKLSLFSQMQVSKINAIILTRKSNPYSTTKLSSNVYTCIDLWVTLLMSAVFKYTEMTFMSMVHIQMIQKAYKES